MISANEMVMETDGKMKPLQEFIKNAGSGGVGAWEISEQATITNNTATAFPDNISAALGETDDIYADIIISFADETSKIINTYVDTWANFKKYFSVDGNNIIYWDKTGAGSSNVNIFQSLGKVDGKYKYKVVVNNLFLQNTHKITFSVR